MTCYLSIFACMVSPWEKLQKKPERRKQRYIDSYNRFIADIKNRQIQKALAGPESLQGLLFCRYGSEYGRQEGSITNNGRKEQAARNNGQGGNIEPSQQEQTQ